MYAQAFDLFMATPFAWFLTAGCFLVAVAAFVCAVRPSTRLRARPVYASLMALMAGAGLVAYGVAPILQNVTL